MQTRRILLKWREWSIQLVRTPYVWPPRDRLTSEEIAKIRSDFIAEFAGPANAHAVMELRRPPRGDEVRH